LNRTSLIFCVASLVATVALSALIYPLAAMPPDVARGLTSPTPAHDAPDIDLGDFGVVSALELVDYYMENPPDPAVGKAIREVHFQGC